MAETRRILVVDDCADTLELIRTMLEMAGYQPVCARNGIQSLLVFDQVRPALVLLDMVMPGMDGVSVAESIRRHSDVPMIMLTVVSDIDSKCRAMRAGVDDYVTKPFKKPVLLARIGAKIRRFPMPDVPP